VAGRRRQPPAEGLVRDRRFDGDESALNLFKCCAHTHNCYNTTTTTTTTTNNNNNNYYYYY
jgi:hypothetical protein